VRDPRADDLRAHFHALFGGEELPVPVEAIAEDLLGLSVEEADPTTSGLLLPAERRVVLNATESPQRRRFTLAHELGHWVCQCLEGQTAPLYCRVRDVSASADRLLEREANVFAAELLMPETGVKEVWSGAASADELAGRFGVSGEAIRWRLYSFGLVHERPGETARPEAKSERTVR